MLSGVGSHLHCHMKRDFNNNNWPKLLANWFECVHSFYRLEYRISDWICLSRRNEEAVAYFQEFLPLDSVIEFTVQCIPSLFETMRTWTFQRSTSCFQNTLYSRIWRKKLNAFHNRVILTVFTAHHTVAILTYYNSALLFSAEGVMSFSARSSSCVFQNAGLRPGHLVLGNVIEVQIGLLYNWEQSLSLRSCLLGRGYFWKTKIILSFIEIKRKQLLFAATWRWNRLNSVQRLATELSISDREHFLHLKE